MRRRPRLTAVPPSPFRRHFLLFLLHGHHLIFGQGSLAKRQTRFRPWGPAPHACCLPQLPASSSRLPGTAPWGLLGKSPLRTGSLPGSPPSLPALTCAPPASAAPAPPRSFHNRGGEERGGRGCRPRERRRALRRPRQGPAAAISRPQARGGDGL